MLAEDFLVLNGEGWLWQAARPLLEAVLRLDQNDHTYTWHGWQKRQIETFLASLPSPSSLIVGVWDTYPATQEQAAQDKLTLGLVCKVEQGVICSIGTFDALLAAGLKPVAELAIDMEDALEIMHYVRRQFAPVAWALFIERSAWDEWLFASEIEAEPVHKGRLLTSLVQNGRCVLMGSQAARNEYQ